MRYLIFFLFVITFVSCGKKQGEVEIKKLDDKKTVNVPDTSHKSKQETNEIKSAGNNEIKKISSKETKSNINQNAVVTGYVADVAIREKVAYLNFDYKFPKNTFTGVIFKEKFKVFGDLSIYKNKTVEINGVITEYGKKPQIILNSISQIKIVK